jgi:hypothetical protein
MDAKKTKLERLRAGTVGNQASARNQYGSLSSLDSEKNSDFQPSPQNQLRLSRDSVPLVENILPPVQRNPLSYIKNLFAKKQQLRQAQVQNAGNSDESELHILAPVPVRRRDMGTQRMPSLSARRELESSYTHRLELENLRLQLQVKELEEKIASDEERMLMRAGQRADGLRSYRISDLFNANLKDITNLKNVNDIEQMKESIEETLDDLEKIINTRFKDITMQGFQQIRKEEMDQINLVYDLFINLSDAIENYENNQDSYETLMGTIVEEVNKLHRMEIAYVSTYR